MGGPTVELADFAVEFSFDKLPKEAVDKTKMCLLDTIGVMAAASTLKIGKAIASFVKAMGGVEEATVICSDFRTSCVNAAFANGSFVETPENQDGIRYGGLHQCSAVIPAALAVGEKRKISGKELITSVIVGYEVSARVAATTHPEQILKGFIPVGTVGPYGAAAAVGKILGFDQNLMANALGIAGFLAPITRIESFFNTCKPFHGGQAAQVGVVAALAAKEGFGGSKEIVESYCKGMVEKPDLSRLTKRLGEKFEIMETYIKPYTACRHTHGSIEATLNLVKAHDIKPKDVQNVKVWTYDVALKLLGTKYTDTNSLFIDAQFSIPYAVAATIMDRTFGIDQISEDRLRDPSVHELAKKVEAVEDPKLTALYPDKTATRVEILTKNGKNRGDTVYFPKGDPRNPFTWRELQDKFNKLATRAIEDSKTKEVMDILLKLEKLSNIKKLIKFLRPEQIG